MDAFPHFSYTDLEGRFENVLHAPRDRGAVQMIVRRPAADEREIIEAGELRPGIGLVGDRWARAGRPLGEQLTLMCSRVTAMLVADPARWPLAGDQLYVDFDLSADSVPPGTRLAVGAAVIEVSEEPHTGCKKFRARFGLDAMRFVGAPERRNLQLRGIYAQVVSPGVVRNGDSIVRL